MTASCGDGGVAPVKDNQGYWLERKDHPRTKWHLNNAAPTLLPAQVAGFQLRDHRYPNPGQMIQGVFDSGITTPASIVPLFQQLLDVSGQSNGSRARPLVEFVFDQGRKVARVTTLGAKRYRLWCSVGLVGQVKKRNEAVGQVDRGEITHRDALSSLVSDSCEFSALADKVAKQIDDLCETWRGMSRNETSNAMAKVAHRLPRLTALPSWMDTEKLLPVEHPLREWRKRMEANLAQSDPAWALLTEQQRAQRRLEWLKEHSEEIPSTGGGDEFSAAMDKDTGRFSALRYWLTGLSTDADH